MQGAAAFSPSMALALTPCAPSATGAAFLPLPLPSPLTPFVALMTFRIRMNPDTPGADGMALGLFVLPRGQRPAMGEGGAGMGYAGVAQNGWVVEIDTYQT